MSAEVRLGTRALTLVTGGAALAAAVLFTAFVLPAEFHRDPLGTGKLTGLNRLAGPRTVAPAASAPAAESGVKFYPTPYRSDVIEIPLATGDAGKGGEELEYKVRMKAGDSLVYSLVVQGVSNPEEFYYDFHGEAPARPPAAEGTVIEYRQATGLSSNGVLIAPMAGVFGWYLQNQSASPAKVTVKLSGFYELVPPGEKGNEAGIVANLKGRP